MGLHIPSREEYDTAKATSGGNGYFPLEEAEYKAKIVSYEKHNDVTQFNEDGHTVIWFTLIPNAFADDLEAELIDKNGNLVPDDKRLTFFFDNTHLGFTPVVSKNRKFLAAAKGVGIGDEIEANSWDEVYDSLLGKEVIVAVTEKDGRNKVTDVRAFKTKPARPRKGAVVAAADDIFNSEPVKSDSEGDDY